MENIWPESVAERDLEGFDPDDSALIDEVVSMGKIMGLEVESEGVHELFKSHNIELNTEVSTYTCHYLLGRAYWHSG